MALQFNPRPAPLGKQPAPKVSRRGLKRVAGVPQHLGGLARGLGPGTFGRARARKGIGVKPAPSGRRYLGG